MPMHPSPLATIEVVPIAVWGPKGSTLTIAVRLVNNHSNFHARFMDCGINPPPSQYCDHTLLDAEATVEPGGCTKQPFAQITWNQSAAAGFVWEDTLSIGVSMLQGPQGPPVSQEVYIFA